MSPPPDRRSQDAMVVLKALGAVAVFGVVMCIGLAFFIASVCKSMKF